MRFPVDLRLYRRDEDVTRWEEFVPTHFPKPAIPTGQKEPTTFPKELDPVLLQEAEFQTKIVLAKELLNVAIRRKLPLRVVLFVGYFCHHGMSSLISVSLIVHGKHQNSTPLFLL